MRFWFTLKIHKPNMAVRGDLILSWLFWNHTHHFQILKVGNYYDTTQQTKYKKKLNLHTLSLAMAIGPQQDKLDEGHTEILIFAK